LYRAESAQDEMWHNLKYVLQHDNDNVGGQHRHQLNGDEEEDGGRPYVYNIR
jgi:hypothetical protein